MLQNITELYGHKLAATDGDIGQIKDFFFNDQSWVIRYLVADTGSWLTGRLVLLSPHALGHLNRTEKILSVNLTRKQIENSPSIDAHKPVSRQYEIEYYRYYGWPTYWDGGAMWGLGGYPVIMPLSKEEIASNHHHHRHDDKHLRSARAITGYQIHTVDGIIGHVSGLMVDEKSWAIGELVVECGHWYAGKEILIAPAKVKRISYEESTVYVSLTKADIQGTAECNVAEAGAGQKAP
jgi:hypothetical protein